MRLGIIGGLGPMATAYFMELIINMTDAHCDREHLEMIIYDFPSIPDRTSFILGKSKDNPVIPMIEIGKQLEAQKADNIAVPCITAHYFYETLTENIKIPIINAIKETVMYLKERGISTAGIAATDGTISANLFQKELMAQGINYVIPSVVNQKYVMDLVYKDIKAGLPPEISKFESISKELRENGAEVIILGCTELSLIKRDYKVRGRYLDAMEVLARSSIIFCHGLLKKEYEDLITG
ncbi:MAG: amino acid racemase [Bacillota bacterium]|nr:amino acid racemase [Bacillota bacterium]